MKTDTNLCIIVEIVQRGTFQAINLDRLHLSFLVETFLENTTFCICSPLKCLRNSVFFQSNSEHYVVMILWWIRIWWALPTFLSKPKRDMHHQRCGYTGMMLECQVWFLYSLTLDKVWHIVARYSKQMVLCSSSLVCISTWYMPSWICRTATWVT